MASGDVVVKSTAGFSPALTLSEDPDSTDDRYLAIGIGIGKDASLPDDPSTQGRASSCTA